MCHCLTAKARTRRSIHTFGAGPGGLGGISEAQSDRAVCAGRRQDPRGRSFGEIQRCDQRVSQPADSGLAEVSDLTGQQGLWQAYQFVTVDARIRFEAFICAHCDLGLKAIVPRKNGCTDNR
jgi:hypothetical protein